MRYSRAVTSGLRHWAGTPRSRAARACRWMFMVDGSGLPCCSIVVVWAAGSPGAVTDTISDAASNQT